MLELRELKLSRRCVGFPANATERLLSVEFRLWFGNDGPQPIAAMTTHRLEKLERWLECAARRQPARVEGADDKADRWTEAAYFVAWHRIAREELAHRRRETGRG